MRKQEIKKALKPLIKECVRDLLLEEGYLSNIVAEVVKGLGGIITEDRPTPPPAQNPPQTRRKINEARKKMADAIGTRGYGGVNLFEGTEPLSSSGAPGSTTQPNSPLANVAPNDPGVDISSLFRSMGTVWNKLK